jgi:probable HAF family extracellular repeat protein
VEVAVKRAILEVFVLILAPIASAQVYTITDLGPMSPTAINSWAQVVGNYKGQAYIWTFGRTRSLGILPGGTFSYAAAINDLGVVVGTADGSGVVSPGNVFESQPSQECSSLTQPFVWKQQMHGLGTVGATDVFEDWCLSPFYSAGINDSGEIVGYTGGLQDDYQWGFLWTTSAGESLLGDSYMPTFATGISNTGQIVGETYAPSLGNATSWKNGVATDLGGLVGFYSSAANGVNDFGQIVGWSTTDIGCYGGPKCMHAVLWTQTGTINDLGTLGSDSDSAASKINLFGLVIGSSGNTYAASTIGDNNDRDQGPLEVIGRPFIWSQRRGMQDLNTLIRAGSGWILISVSDINVWGQIVGSGTLNGQPHGFLLTPRDPFNL